MFRKPQKVLCLSGRFFIQNRIPLGSPALISNPVRSITFFDKDSKYVDPSRKKIRKMHPPILFVGGMFILTFLGILYFYLNCEEYFINNAQNYYNKGGGLPNPIPEEHRQEYVYFKIHF